jgi:hypothetical protein
MQGNKKVRIMGGAIIDWYSRKQPIVSLSTTEAELISYTIICQAARFVQKLLYEITNKAETAVMFEDNTGCIFLIRNHKTGERTKHIDIQYFWGLELCMRGKTVPYFVPSENNWSDGCTKNLMQKTFLHHQRVLMEDVILALKSRKVSRHDWSAFGIPSRVAENG